MFFKRFSSFVFLIAIIDIFLRILTFIKNNIGLKDVAYLIGKYFPERYYADVCIDGNYYSEYFPTEKALFEWLTKLTNNRVKSVEDIENFNADYEDSGNDDENFINVYEYDLSDE